MKKLRLDPEELTVESFSSTGDKEKERGTVHGHDTETHWSACLWTDCAETCQGCGNTSYSGDHNCLCNCETQVC